MTPRPAAAGPPMLFRLNGVPVKVAPAFWADMAFVAGVLIWLAGRRWAARGWGARLGGMALVLPLGLSADLFHVFGHTVSARLAGTPMDEIRLTAGMPRTLYFDNTVPPRTHRLRASGGLVANLLALLLGLLGRRVTAPGSIAHDLAGVVVLGHGFIFGTSLVPVPMVDGGTILKWTLVEHGLSEAEADARVHQISALIGGGALAAGAVLVVRGPRLAGVALVGGGLIALAAARDIIR